MEDNKFIGLLPYTEADAYRFKGRSEESQELFRMIVRNDYTVCYAESGEGKTSLLNAGVFPLLRQNMYFPIAITFTSDDYQHTPDSFDTIIERCIKNSIDNYNENDKGVNVEYKLCSTDFHDTDCQSELQKELSKYSWWKLRNFKPQVLGLTFSPVFVFDQFEEVFNSPGSIVWTKKFFDWLEAVSSDNCPDEIIKAIRSIVGAKAAFPEIKERKDFKAIFSLRKEYIGELDYWGMQRCFIPSLRDNRYCLKALTYEGAKNVMDQQERFEKAKVKQVLDFFVKEYSREPEETIAENLPIIPALLLSVVCDSWEKDLGYFSNKDTSDIKLSLDKILVRFYNDTVNSVVRKKIKEQDNDVSPDLLCNEIHSAMFALVDANGKRIRMKTTSPILMQMRFDENYKKLLSDSRIIRIIKIDGEDYVEIVHDALCRIIANIKEQDDLKVQSLYLAEKANNLVDQGDSYTARLLALEALPKNLNHPDRPFVSEAEFALRNADRQGTWIVNGMGDYTFRMGYLSSYGQIVSYWAKLHGASGITRWGLKAGNMLTTYSASEYNYEGIGFASHGANIVTNNKDGVIFVWDAKDKTLVCKMDGIQKHKGTIYRIDFDGKYVLSGDENGCLKLWDVPKGKCLFSDQEDNPIDKTILGIRFFAAYYQESRRLKIWEKINKKMVNVLTLEESEVTWGPVPIVFIDNIIVIGLSTGIIRLVNVHTMETIHVIEAHSSPVTQLYYKDKYLLSGFQNGDVKVWLLADDYSATCSINLSGHHKGYIVYLYYVEGYIISADHQVVKKWKAPSALEPLEYRNDRIKVKEICAISHSKISVLGYDNKFYVWDWENATFKKTNKPKHIIGTIDKGEEKKIISNDLVFEYRNGYGNIINEKDIYKKSAIDNNNEHGLDMNKKDYHIDIFSNYSKEIIESISGEDCWISDIEYDGNYLVVLFDDGSLKIWEYQGLQDVMTQVKVRLKNRQLTKEERALYHCDTKQ